MQLIFFVRILNWLWYYVTTFCTQKMLALHTWKSVLYNKPRRQLWSKWLHRIYRLNKQNTAALKIFFKPSYLQKPSKILQSKQTIWFWKISANFSACLNVFLSFFFSLNTINQYICTAFCWFFPWSVKKCWWLDSTSVQSCKICVRDCL